MGEETARLRNEIDRTREDLTRDVDLIAEKTSPSRIVERRVERTRRGLTGLKERVMGSSHGSDRDDRYGPDGAGYYGDAYLGGGEYGSVTGATSGGQDASARGGMSSAREGVGQAATAVQDRAQGALHGAQDAAHRVSGTAQDTVSSARRQAEGNPLAAGLVAFGIGWLVSSLLPASQAEMRATERVQDAAKEHGGPVVEHAKQAASEVGETLKGSAQEAVQQVKEHAQDAAQTVKDEGASAARTVKDEGTSAAQTVSDDARTQATSGSSQGRTY